MRGEYHNNCSWCFFFLLITFVAKKKKKYMAEGETSLFASSSLPSAPWFYKNRNLFTLNYHFNHLGGIHHKNDWFWVYDRNIPIPMRALVDPQIVVRSQGPWREEQNRSSIKIFSRYIEPISNFFYGNGPGLLTTKHQIFICIAPKFGLEYSFIYVSNQIKSFFYDILQKSSSILALNFPTDIILSSMFDGAHKQIVIRILFILA